MTYGYIRVSTDKQTVENQRYEITEFCKKEVLSVDDWIEETISGTKEALELRRKEGVKLGRLYGRQNNKCKLDGAELAFSVMIFAGTSVNKMAKLYGMHRNTVKRFIERHKLDSLENMEMVRNLG